MRGWPIPPSFGGVGLFACRTTMPGEQKDPPGQNQPGWATHEHAMQKVPFQLVLGDREMEAGEVNVRVRGQEKAEGSVPVDAFVERVKKLIETKAATF